MVCRGPQVLVPALLSGDASSLGLPLQALQPRIR
jgi:hypothetical protein